MSQNVVFTLGNFPPGACWTGLQDYGNQLISLLTGTINSTGKLIVGPNAPGPSDQDAVWYRTVGGYLEGAYLYLGGWYRPHPVPPSSASRIMWRDTEANLWSYDGGDGTDPGSIAPTATTGAMWQVDHDMDFLIPIGAGTSPTTYDSQPATVINQGDTAGAERVQLAAKEHKYHDHSFVASPPAATGFTVACLDAGTDWGYVGTTHTYKQQQASSFGGDPVDFHTWYHQNLPPVRGVFWAKRTVRQYLVAT